MVVLGQRSRRWRVEVLPRGRAAVVGCALAMALVLGIQAANLDVLIDVHLPLTAGFAKGLVLGYAVAALAVVASAAFVSEARLGRVVAGAMAVATLIVLASLSFGLEAWSFAWALLTMCACWQLGTWVLRALKVDAVANIPAAAWLAGAGIGGLALLFIGRVGLISLWTVAVPAALLGGLGALRLTRALPLRAAWTAATGTRLAAACTALGVLTLGLSSVWTAAPELGFDALYYKSWLPELWARSGDITSSTLHPVLNFSGTAQLLAVPGHAAEAAAVGRYLQWFAVPAIAGTIWWEARRSAWAPIAALVIVITPHVFWQSTTAYDDAVLALGALGAAVAVFHLLRAPEVSPGLTGAALGLLTASCLNLKIHLVPLALGLTVGWLVVRARNSTLAALGGLVITGALVALPPLILRWVDTGNPLFPSYNNVFHSSLWPPVNLSFNFPRMPDPGPFGPLHVLWTSLTGPGVLESVAPIGALGLLSLAVAVALVTAFRRGPQFALWLGLLFGAISWYVQFRNVRYLLPAAVLAVLLLALTVPVERPGRRLELASLATVLALAIALWPSTVSQFYYVPGRDIPWKAAFGEIDDGDYERIATPMREAVAGFDRTAPPGAVAAGEPHQRAWLTDGRSLTPYWELELRLRADGPLTNDPAQTRARVRAAGVHWMLVTQHDSLRFFPPFQRMLEEFGTIVWKTPYATLYRL